MITMTMTDTSHLRGLRRLSPCCRARVAHNLPWDDPDCLSLICLKCRRPIVEHELWNAQGERVWPVSLPDGPAPPPPVRSRCIPKEAEPPAYPLHLPLGFLRNLK